MPANEDGWTQVGRKKGRLRHVAAAPVSSPDSETSSCEVMPNPHPTLTPILIRKQHATYKAEWQDSECRRTLEAVLKMKNKAGEMPAIKKAVCLGPGSFDPSNDSWSAKRTAHIQVEAFLFLVEKLSTQTVGEQPACIIQEPAFTAADKAFLETLGFSVARGNSAYDEIDEQTLVFGIHLYMGTLCKALREVAPAVFVGTDIDKLRELPDTFQHGMSGQLAAEIDEKYGSMVFPAMDHIFSTTTMYWRKPEEDDLAKCVEGLKIDGEEGETGEESGEQEVSEKKDG